MFKISKTHINHKKWMLLIIALGPALFDNNRLVSLSGGYKNLHYLTNLLLHFTCIKKNKKIDLKKLRSVACI
jgi:hypothetical protein